jgi:hypothetical protein
LLLLLVCQSIFSGNGLLFNISATGIPDRVNLTLCLNGKGPLSCQNYTVSASTLSILTTIPDHTYPFAGIKINTPHYEISDLKLVCTPYGNGYCLFSVSDTIAKTIHLMSGVLVLNPSTLPYGTLSTSYNQTITASGGAGPYTYAVTSGTLPSGLTLSSGGVLSGTPTSSSTTSFTVTAIDTNSADTGSQGYSLSVLDPALLTSCVYSFSSNDLSCIGANLTALGAGSSIYRHYTGSSCTFSGNIFAIPGTATFTATSYITGPAISPLIINCGVSLCNNNTCSGAETNSVIITSGS